MVESTCFFYQWENKQDIKRKVKSNERYVGVSPNSQSILIGFGFVS